MRIEVVVLGVTRVAIELAAAALRARRETRLLASAAELAALSADQPCAATAGDGQPQLRSPVGALGELAPHALVIDASGGQQPFVVLQQHAPRLKTCAFALLEWTRETAVPAWARHRCIGFSLRESSECIESVTMYADEASPHALNCVLTFFRDDLGRRVVFAAGSKADPASDEQAHTACTWSRSRRAIPACAPTLLSSSAAHAWQTEDGMLAVCPRSRGNMIDVPLVAAWHEALMLAEERQQPLLFCHEGRDFSVGANLPLVAGWACAGHWERIRQLVRNFQRLTHGMLRATVPTVAAPFGRTLGGGLELCLASSVVIAPPGVSVGLVEPQLGLVPGGGGTLWLWSHEYNRCATSIDLREQGQDLAAWRIWQQVAGARIATGAHEARRTGLLPGTTVVADAEQVSWALAHSCVRRQAAKQADDDTLPLASSGFLARVEAHLQVELTCGRMTEHDALIAGKLATLLTGGGSSTGRAPIRALLELEQEAFLSLCGEAKSQARMKHMLEHGTRLRN